MTRQINIGILGFGKVGSAVAEVFSKNHSFIAENSGVDIRIKKVCDIRKIHCPFPVTRNPYEIIKDPEISVVVEAIGGVNPALKYILAAIRQGKHVVTPNKEVIAKHLPEILSAASKKGVQVFFEGAVGGGIPIIRALRESLSSNRISEIYGIVNGTTNYILSQMTEKGIELSEALKRAKEKGYAEPDPTLDVSGYDAGCKAAILASVAFGAKVSWKDVYYEGIKDISLEDIRYASEIGYLIKLLAVTRLVDDGLEVRVHPVLISKSHPLASVSKNYNAIYVKGYPVGDLMFYGQGAGGEPTASAIISDIIASANPKSLAGQAKIQNPKLRNFKIRKIDEIESRYYIRLQAPDRCGVLAGISKAFADKKVSIAAVTQKETIGKPGRSGVATIVILIHRVAEKNLNQALSVIKKLPVVKKVCSVTRIV